MTPIATKERPALGVPETVPTEPPPSTAFPPATAPGRLIERFLPEADHGGRHETLVKAPADLVFETACTLDMQAHPLARAIFRLREILFRAARTPPRRPVGIVEETRGLGWGVLAERPGRELVMGAVTRPWEANVVFRAVPPEDFPGFTEPGLVKIAWTLEAEPLGPARTRFRTETRALATDEEARRRFRRYWLMVGAGILSLRVLMLPRIRREAERRYRSGSGLPRGRSVASGS